MTGGPGVDNSFNVSNVASGNTFGDNATVTTNLIIYQMAGRVERSSLPAGANPYRGLKPFTEADAERFFGREKLVEVLWDRFRDLAAPPFNEGAQRLLAVLGPSGSGKSSLARAGLVAELRRRPFDAARETQRVAVLTPREKPLESLATVLARIADPDATMAKIADFTDALARADRHGVYDGLRRVAESLPNAATQPLVILIDQFEELYSLCKAADDRRIFIATLLDACSSRSGIVSVVITMRSDFLGASQADNVLNQVIARQSLIVPTMSADELRRAIALPAERASPPHSIDEDTIRRLVAETEGRDGALPLMQFALESIWERLPETSPKATLDQLGGVGGALGATAEELFGKLSAPQQKIAQRAFLSMVEFNDNGQPTRHRALLSDAVADDKDVDDAQEMADLRTVLDAFAAARLVTLAGSTDATLTVEVSHEAIFQHWPRLRDWLSENMGNIRLHRRLNEAANLWETEGRPEGSLLRRPSLDIMRDLKKQTGSGLSPLEGQFLQASEDGERLRRRTARAAIGGLVALTVAAGGLGWFGLNQSARASVQRSNVLAAASRQAVAAGETARGLLLAIEALPRGKADAADYAQARGALRSALLNSAEIRTLRDEPGARFTAADARGVGALQNGVLPLLDLWKGRQTGAIRGVSRYAISPDRSRIVTFGPEGRARFWDFATGARIATPGLHAEPFRPTAARMAFSPDGQRLAISPDGIQAPLIWNLAAGTAPVALRGAPLKPYAGLATVAFTFSATGRELAIQSSSDPFLWDTQTGARIQRDLGPRGIIAGFSPGGRYVAVFDIKASGKRGTCVREVATGHQVMCVDGDFAAFSPSDTLLAAREGSEATIYPISSGGEAERTAPLRLPDEDSTLEFSRDGRLLLIASKNGGTLTLWDLATSAPRGRPMTASPGTFWAVRQMDYGSVIVTRTDFAEAPRLWSLARAMGWKPLADARTRAPPSAVGPRLLSYDFAENPSPLRVWDVATGKPLTTVSGEMARGHANYGSVAGGFVATTAEGRVSLWELSGRLVRSGSHDAYGSAFSADGQRLIIATRDGAEIREVPSLKLVSGVKLGEQEAVGFSPEGRYAFASWDGTRVWTVSGRGSPRRFEGRLWPGSQPFSHDGKRVATLSRDQRAVRLWDPETGRLKATIPLTASFSGADDEIDLHGGEISFSPGDDFVLVQFATRIVVLDVAGAAQLAEWPLVDFQQVAFAPNGHQLVGVRDDSSAFLELGPLSGAALRAEGCRRKTRELAQEERLTYGLGKSAASCPATGRFPWLAWGR